MSAANVRVRASHTAHFKQRLFEQHTHTDSLGRTYNRKTLLRAKLRPNMNVHSTVATAALIREHSVDIGQSALTIRSKDSKRGFASRRNNSRENLPLLTQVAPSSTVPTDDPYAEAERAKVVAYTAGAMFMYNAHRVILSVVAVSVGEYLEISMTTLGVISSCFLWSYGALQLPVGHLADKYGGPRVLVFCLMLCSIASLLTPLTLYTPYPVLLFGLMRILLGAASAAALPATAATLSKFALPQYKATATASVYGMFNMGTVAGIAGTTLITTTLGWSAAFLTAGVLGIIYCQAAWLWLPKAALARPQVVTSKETAGSVSFGDSVKELWQMRVRSKVQVLGLCWAHGVIGWGFFILQSWMPVFFEKALGVGSLRTVGLMSAIPWLLTAIVTVSGGKLADWLLNHHKMKRPKVRQWMMTVATFGPALCMALLVHVGREGGAAVATVLLMGVLGAQAFNYAGFHPYLLEVAGHRSGFLLSITNSVGIMMGVIGNIAAGWLIDKSGDFQLLFTITAALYASSGVMWNLLMTGESLFVEPNVALEQ